MFMFVVIVCRVVQVLWTLCGLVFLGAGGLGCLIFKVLCSLCVAPSVVGVGVVLDF